MASTGQSNTTIDYGLGGGWEVGLNVFNASFYGDFGPGGPTGANNESVLMNLQRVFEVDDDLHIETGIQAGGSVIDKQRNEQFSHFEWVTGRYSLDEGLPGEYTIGIYNGSPAYLGSRDSAGFMLGAEIPVVKDRLSFVADYISGQSDLSVAVVGFQYTIDPKNGWVISAGAQIPSPHSGNPYGVVIEFTKMPIMEQDDFAGRSKWSALQRVAKR